MIIARSPLRVTLGGGGTDLPSYYKKKEGFLISAAIDKYVYVTITRPFKEGIYLKYSKIEKVKKVSEVLHPIIREVLKEQNFKIPQIEITTLTDIPSGTGLGSSGSFTTALIKGLYSYQNKKIEAESLAQKACDIELNKLTTPAWDLINLNEFEMKLDSYYNPKKLPLKFENIKILIKDLDD